MSLSEMWRYWVGFCRLSLLFVYCKSWVCCLVKFILIEWLSELLLPFLDPHFMRIVHVQWACSYVWPLLLNCRMAVPHYRLYVNKMLLIRQKCCLFRDAWSWDCAATLISEDFHWCSRGNFLLPLLLPVCFYVCLLFSSFVLSVSLRWLLSDLLHRLLHRFTGKNLSTALTCFCPSQLRLFSCRLLFSLMVVVAWVNTAEFWVLASVFSWRSHFLFVYILRCNRYVL
jgi:hypothetical protein